MASINKLYKQNIKNTKKQMNDVIKSNNKATAGQVSSVNKKYESAANELKGDAALSQSKLDQNYQGSYDLNAVSQLVAERQLKERMANSGSQNSGINDSQNIAIATARMNADNAVTSQKNAAKSSIEEALYKSLAEQERTRAQEVARLEAENEQNNAAIRNSYYQNAYSSAVDQHNTAATNRATVEAERIKNAREVEIANINADAKIRAAEISAAGKEDKVADKITSAAKNIYNQKIGQGLTDYSYTDAVNEATIGLAMTDPETNGIDPVILKRMYQNGGESVKAQCEEYMKMLYTYSKVAKVNGIKIDTSFNDFAKYYETVTGKTITDGEAYKWAFE